MFVFELARYNLAAQQLKNCLDSAALCAACSTTASNSQSASVTQTNAMNQAAYMFSQNTILDHPLLDTPAYSYGTTPPTWAALPNRAQLYFEFLDPVTKLPVPYGSPNGKILRVFGCFGFVPSTAKFIGLMNGPYLIQDQSDGGLPQLDVVLCFDISSSMDDFTNVSLVNRYDAGGTNAYALPKQITVGGNPTVQGPLFYALGATNDLGISANATWPMDLDSTGQPGFTPSQGSYQFNAGGYGTTSGAPSESLATENGFNGGLSFTDLVVNLDGTSNMSAGVTINGFNFPADDPTHKGLGILVEASRGNLESVAAANAAHVPYAAWGIVPRAGWFQAYYQAVMSAQPAFPDTTVAVPLRHPIGDAIVAAENFFGILNNDADVHFGLVTFSSNAGTVSSPGPGYDVGSFHDIRNGGGGAPNPTPHPLDPISPPNPAIYLNPTAGPSYSNFSTTTPAPITSVNGALFTLNGNPAPYNFSTVMAEGGTNIRDALDRALAMNLGSKPTDPPTTPMGRSGQSLARPGATRAIVLFTDGLPNGGGDNGTSDPNSQAEASFSKTCGIPVYTIGLCMVPSLQANQTQVLTDKPGSTGIAALSGNGATFSQTTSAAGLNGVFQNVARQLVQLVQ
jgi:hypothetical protein